MRIVALALVGVALIGGAFGLGRVTRASADDPPAPQAAGDARAAGGRAARLGVGTVRGRVASRPAPRAAQAEEEAHRRRTPPVDDRLVDGATAAAATPAPSSPQPSTPAPSKPKPKPPPKPVEEIG